MHDFIKEDMVRKQMLVLYYNLLAFIFLWMYEGKALTQIRRCLMLFDPKLSLFYCHQGGKTEALSKILLASYHTDF